MASTTVTEPPDTRAARQHSVGVERYSVTGNPAATRAVVERLNGTIVTVGHNNSVVSDEELEREARLLARQYDAVYVPQEPAPDLPELSEEDREAFEQNERRTKFVAGLRELASFLVAHPDVPVYHGTMSLDFSVNDGDGDEAAIARVRTAAAALGVEAKEYSPGYWRAERQFGPIKYGCGYIERGTWARVVAADTYNGVVEPDGGTAS